MNNPVNEAKVGASSLAACGYAPVQWKIAPGWMREHVRVGKRAGLAAYSTCDPLDRRNQLDR
jgi:hypothetical protein